MSLASISSMILRKSWIAQLINVAAFSSNVLLVSIIFTSFVCFPFRNIAVKIGYPLGFSIRYPVKKISYSFNYFL